jgi:hypothetical protein
MLDDSILNFESLSHTHDFKERFWVHSLGGHEVCARLF